MTSIARITMREATGPTEEKHREAIVKLFGPCWVEETQYIKALKAVWYSGAWKESV